MNTLILALVAHLLGDFVLQPTVMVERKRHPVWLTTHCLTVTAATIVLLGSFVPQQIGRPEYIFFSVLFGSHLLIDFCKTFLLPDTWWSFLLDQLLHISVIVGLCSYTGDIAANGLWTNQLSPDQFKLLMRYSIIAGGFIAACLFGGILIGKLTKTIAPDEAGEGIDGAGTYIGWLERVIVMTLVLANELSGIGFLITAKSILRFGQSSSADTKVNNDTNRKASEYIIIGTFLSFGWGLLVAMITRKIQGYYD